jgi:hypothetical protein
LRDWLVVSGWIDAKSSTYQRARRRVKEIVEGWMPALLRSLTLLLVLMITVDRWPLMTNRAETVILLPIGFLALLLIGSGVLGRIGAIVLIGLSLLDIWLSGFQWSNGLLLGSSIWIAQAGSGYFSLWRPEEVLLRRQAGAARSEAPDAEIESTAA